MVLRDRQGFGTNFWPFEGVAIARSFHLLHLGWADSG